MAAIKYTSIINSFVSQEGAFGAFTNYIYYSVLVVYSDGTKEIIEGKGKEIAPLLSFLRTPVDELQEIKQLIASIPAEIRNISDYMTDVIDILDEICENANDVKSEEPVLAEERDDSEDSIISEPISDTPFICYCRNCKSFFWATSKNKKDKCPKCGEVFQIDEAGYAEIVKQVRNQEFNAELQRQKQTMDNELSHT